MNAQLAALIGSRICHDLISPIGAINNGLELLTMSGDAGGPEINLIGESVDNACARIRFFRIAFGAAGEQMVGHGEIGTILKDLYDGGRLSVSWGIDGPVSRADLRLAFLAILCIETAMPYGGRLEISTSDQGWQFAGKADRINIDAALWQMLSKPQISVDLQPSHVQFALLPLLSKEDGRQIKCHSDETTLSLTY